MKPPLKPLGLIVCMIDLIQTSFILRRGRTISHFNDFLKSTTYGHRTLKLQYRVDRLEIQNKFERYVCSLKSTDGSEIRAVILPGHL